MQTLLYLLLQEVHLPFQKFSLVFYLYLHLFGKIQEKLLQQEHPELKNVILLQSFMKNEINSLVELKPEKGFQLELPFKKKIIILASKLA